MLLKLKSTVIGFANNNFPYFLSAIVSNVKESISTIYDFKSLVNIIIFFFLLLLN